MDYFKKEKILKMFGETAIFTELERDEARSYLNSWKKYLLRRLNRDCYNLKIIDEQWGEIPAHFSGVLCQTTTLYLKIIIEFEWNYDNCEKLQGINIKEEDLENEEK